ncbi:MAG: hypothetical protein ACKVE4_03490 [Dissulfuribacterales bacterium]
MEPEERKEIPPHFKGLGVKEIIPMLEKVVREVKKFGFGRPNESISYRDYLTFKQKGKSGLEKKRVGLISAPKKAKHVK